MNIQTDIINFLESSGWSQAKLAKKADIHPIIISRIVRGERKGLHSSTLEKLWPFLYANEVAELTPNFPKSAASPPE